MIRRCDQCEAYDAQSTQCRRNAPGNFLLGMVEGEVLVGEGRRMKSPAMFGTWPAVDPSDWCMQFAPKAEDATGSG